MVGSVATGIILVIVMAANGIPDSEIIPRLNSVSGLLLKLIAVHGFTVIGGYFAGQLARQSYLIHGALVAGIGLLLSMLCIESNTALWYRVLHYAGMIPAGIAGGYLAKLRYGNDDRINRDQDRMQR